MRNLVWVALAAVVLLGGYMLFTGKSVTEVVEDATETVEEIEAPTALEDAGATVGAATEQAAEAVKDTAADAAQSASDAAESVEAATEEAVDAVTDTANTAAEAASDAATDAASTAGNAAAEAVETATEPAADAAPATEMPEVLTTEGFDMDAASQLIKDAGLGEMQENLLIEGLRASQDNPELLKAALETTQKALGY